MADWSIGDWAFVYSAEDEYWYPAKIITATGKRYKVRHEFDDSQDWVEADALAGYHTFPGEEGAECWFEADEAFYAVNILELRNNEVRVEYEDGTKEWTDLSFLRFEKKVKAE
jgi:hypothetical protein